MSKPDLQDALEPIYPKRTRSLPHPLPIAHATPARFFSQIADDGVLKPTKCAVFGDERLYLYYGGVYYRSSLEPTRAEDRLPVAFLFDPSAIRHLKCCFPFDTGAVCTSKFGNKWKTALDPLARFRVTPAWGIRTPSVIVKEFYGDNTQYLAGNVAPPASGRVEPLPLLQEFLSADLSPCGADQRQSTIECHFERALKLKPQNGLLWVGYPNALQHVFDKLCDLSFPSVPKPYPYTYRTPFRPSDLESRLEQAAHQEVERYTHDR